MPLYTQSIKNLKGGISQQPDILRFQDQGEQQINGWSSESDGLQKRPPTVWTNRLDSVLDSLPDNTKFHLINRDEEEQYYIAFTGSTIRVFGLDGTEYSVTGDMGYVSTVSPRSALRVTTVADYTFVVNRFVVVKEGSATSHPGYDMKHRALINLRGGQYGRTLKVSINGGPEVEHKLPAGNDAENDPPKVDAQYIGGELRTLLVAAYPDYTFNLGSGYLEIIAPAGQDITSVETADGYANQLITAILDTVQTISKLPLAAPDGYIIRIQGETNQTADEYYVRYDAARKTWRETVEPGVTTGFAKTTMPHALVRQADGSFTFEVIDWSERGSGNDDTNPMPSFVGSTINDVFFYRNRLGFLSGENVIMSRSAGYFAFFPKSVATISDDDPIDVAVSHPRISLLKYAVPFSEQLLLWSDEVQFVMTSSGVLTSKSIQLDVGSEFAVSDNSRPYAIGRSVFFAAPRGSFTSINRYFAVADVTDVKDADDTTGHVLSYIPNGVFDIQGSSTENFLSVLSRGADNKVFIYKFLFKDGIQLQASWSHWEFPVGDKILAAACIGSTMYIIRKHSSGIDMEKLTFIKESTDFAGEPYRIHADSKCEVTTPTENYDAETNSTSVVIPAHLSTSSTIVAVSAQGVYMDIDGTLAEPSTEYFNLIALGDSTVDGNGTTGWIANPVNTDGSAQGQTDHREQSLKAWPTLVNAELSTREVYNGGYSGRAIIDNWAIDNIQTILSNPTTPNAKYATVCFGLNDLTRTNWSVDTFKSKYAELISRIREFGIEPIIMTSQPATNNSARPWATVQDVLVPAQRQVASENGCKLIDLNHMLITSGEDLATLQPDGLHFNDAGHELVKSLVLPAIESITMDTTFLVKVKGDASGKWFMGQKFKMTYEFSRFLIKHEDQNGTVTEDTGRLQLRRAWINYQDTGALIMRVFNGSSTYENKLNGYTLGQQTVGQTNIGGGQFRFPMNGDARKTKLILESDYPTPVSIVGCGWEASYARKAQSI